MKKIIKQSEPRSLVEHRAKQRANENADYDNYSDKDNLRDYLLKEQGYICCYCMSRIKLDEMKIEHWQPQTKYLSQQLDYKNLLGACIGNQGARPQNQHCDTKKGDSEIIINPIEGDKNCENLVKYRPDGKIYSDDISINHDLNETLNLNLGFLKKNRKDALDVVIRKLDEKFSNKTWAKITVQREIEKLNTKDENGFFDVYCQFIISFLKSKL
ncbi:TIGR02646 family protein [Pseudanabaena sp. UWO311]|uniref:retron system putative HNH endonuclease n=1 Tax=Pseudanabaena sp. UWO311 TaxID=2487337 RepID=UPI00115A0464|nr:retron system putative HNH endonuclease [Pseudanabaena sp. UWO311]TYQ29142.1 TIGR02646 family protein [Pseudanabaena sp. UWO311]